MKRGVTYRIVARRWFQRSYGNTYHSTAVIATSGIGHAYKEELLGCVDYAYGYGEQYLETAFGILVDAKVYRKEDRDKFRDDLRNHRERFAIFVTDVDRKNDL